MGPRVLLVEDSVTQAVAIRYWLEQAGYAAEWSQTAEEALERLNAGLPDLVIADYHLPGMNGDALVRQMRQNTRTRGVPVLMLTEASEEGLERQGLESGADAYVPKSAGPDLMGLRIRALLRRRPAETAEAGRHPAEVMRRARLLVVGDEADRRDDVGGLLSREGYRVETAIVADAAGRVAAAPADWDGVVVCFGAGTAALQLVRTLADSRDAAGDNGARFGLAVLARDERAAPVAYEAGADDVVSGVDDEAVPVRVRALVRRKLLQDEDLRLTQERQERELAVIRAQGEALAAEARAQMAEQLAHANTELEGTNRKLRDTQSQLVQAAKMASLGELVAGIAHEINNPLAFILAHQRTVLEQVEVLGAHLDGAPEAARAADKIRARLGTIGGGLKRIEDIVVNLRRFSRLDEGERQVVDVHQSLDTVLDLLAHKLGDRIEVLRRYEADDALDCSPALFNQVVMNIVGNAADAIEGPGTITVATRSDPETTRIVIDDTGPGVPVSLKERVFEPFFTTKPVGAGTGLGLSIAFSVVKAHNGELDIGDAPGGGARFTIAVPRQHRDGQP